MGCAWLMPGRETLPFHAKKGTHPFFTKKGCVPFLVARPGIS
jgi:hypothetical protein